MYVTHSVSGDFQENFDIASVFSSRILDNIILGYMIKISENFAHF